MHPLEVAATPPSTWEGALGWLVAFGIIPAITAAITGRINHRGIKRIEDKTTAVEATLSTNNGGSHIKDQLDRIERRQEAHEEQAARLVIGLDEANRKVDGLATQVAADSQAIVVLTGRIPPLDQP